MKFKKLKKYERILRNISDRLEVNPKELPKSVERLRREIEKMKEEIKDIKRRREEI